MAKSKVSNAQLVREFIASKPEATAADVDKHFKGKITKAVIYNTMSLIRGKNGSTKKAKKSTKKAVASDRVELSSLVKAKHFVDECGGIDKAKHLINCFSKLV